jgi:catechol 2,3-dioxygenase-like lactoylglutathione lyase family enzyme
MPARFVPELICTDLARSFQVYAGLLGFRVRYSRPDERFAYLERDGAEISSLARQDNFEA